MRWLGSRVSPEGVKPCLDLLKDQVESAGHYEYPLLISMLQLMTCLTEENVVSSHLPLETIQRWMEISNWLIRSTYCRGILTHVAKLLRAVIKVNRFSILVNCLLKVFVIFKIIIFYRRLASDLDNCFISLKKDENYVCSETEENALLFLSPLADLGIARFISKRIWLICNKIYCQQGVAAASWACGPAIPV